MKLIVKQKSLKVNLVCAASSSNTYTQTFTGIDEAGKRLADEVSLDIYEIYLPKVWTSKFSSDSLECVMNYFMLYHNRSCKW